jgi:hypothetical protein
MDTPRRPSERVNQPAPQDFELELEEVEQDTKPRAKRYVSELNAEDDLLDVTFTKTGESLLAKKNAYSRATSLASSRSSWRRMQEDFKALNGKKQLLLRTIVGMFALLVAFWLVAAGWRAVAFVVNSGKAVARDVAGKLRPNVATLQETSQQFTEKMRGLWNEMQPNEDETAAVLIPKRAEAQRIDGNAWPARNQDQLTSDDLVAPTAVIDGILVHKGVPLTSDGLGVFHVDLPMTPEKPAWIGGFGLLKKPGVPLKALLHGTVVHHAENEKIFVARYLRGEMGDFWIVSGPEEKRVVVYVRTTTEKGKPTPDGAAFVLDLHRTDCLAFVFENGEAIGAQWCGKKRDENGEIVYEPPTDIVSLSALKADSVEFPEYENCLQQALGELLGMHNAANATLQKHKRKID